MLSFSLVLLFTNLELATHAVKWLKCHIMGTIRSCTSITSLTSGCSLLVKRRFPQMMDMLLCWQPTRPEWCSTDGAGSQCVRKLMDQTQPSVSEWAEKKKTWKDEITRQRGEQTGEILILQLVKYPLNRETIYKWVESINKNQTGTLSNLL